MTHKVNVYDDDRIVAVVNYNKNLDFWDGRNWSCGTVGYHKGLTKLRNGKYVLIHGTDWQGQKDYAEIISADQALQEILKSGNIELLNSKKYDELKILYENLMQEEVDGEN